MLALITSASHAEAHRLKRLLNDFQVLLGDADIPVMTGTMLRIPRHASASYAHEMLALCLDHQVTHLFALDIKEIQELSKSLLLFEEYGIRVVIPAQADLGNSQEGKHLPDSNLAVVLDGNCIAGDLPAQNLQDLPESGVFEWGIQNNEFKFQTFIISHA